MNDINKTVKEIAAEIGISQELVNRRLKLLGFSARDTDMLRRRREWFSDVIRDIAIRFYARFGEYEEVARLFPARGSLDEFIPKLQAYILDSFLGEPNIEYVLRRFRAGIVYQGEGVTQELYLAVYSWILDELIKAIHSRPGESTESQEEITSALRKIGFFDIGLVLEAYAHANHQAIEYLANHDRLTGLPNYNLLTERLDNRLTRKPHSTGVCVFFVGLSRFKSINETLGHPVGDEILKEVAGRLSRIVSSCCLVSRLGGDIFVLVSDRSESSEAAEEISQKILSTLQTPIDLEGFSVDITATIGIACAASSELDATMLMRQAEMAMYHAKAQQVPTTIFEMEMKRYSLAQLNLGADLRRAIESNELVLFYQPKIGISDDKAIGVEALVRWIHPIKGFMNPGQFIPFAEQTVLIHPLTDWVLETAVAQAAAWQRKGIDLVVSVNLAAPSLQNHRLPGHLKNLLAAHDVEPSKLMIEITESGLMSDPGRALLTLDGFRKQGIRLSIDDFGTGYSSLAYLKTLPVDEVKVDQTFVFGLKKNKNDDQIVRATIKLGHSLDLEVAAEGVEDQETLDKLRIYGCDTVQGFFFSKALPSDELEIWLEKRENKSSDSQKRTSHPPQKLYTLVVGDNAPYIIWKDEYATGIDKIDAQHKILFASVNSIFNATRSGGTDKDLLKKVFEELTEYAQTHFDTEENYLIMNNYPDLEMHFEQHRGFTERLKTLKYDIIRPSHQQEVLSFLKSWMLKHILETDMQYIHHFTQQGVADIRD